MSVQDFVIKDGVLEKYIGNGGDIVIPEGVVSFGYGAFDDDVKISSVTLPESIRSCSSFFNDRKGLRKNKYDNAYYLGTKDNPYFYLLSAKDKHIPSCEIHKDTAIIGFLAFSICENLTDIVIPDNVKYIDQSAFFYSKILRLTIGAGVKNIGNCAFKGCYHIEEINYNATELEDLTKYNGIFEEASKHGNGISVKIGKNVRRIPAYLFGAIVNYEDHPNVISLEFEEGSICESIGECAFSSCTKINIKNFGENLKSIDICAFDNCQNLRSVILPDSLEFIAERAFSNCMSLRELKLSASLKTIGKAAFYSCYMFETLQIPDSVTEIGQAAFKDCVYLVDVSVGCNVSKLGNEAFYNCYRMKRINIPNSVKEIGEGAFGFCTVLSAVRFEECSGFTAGDVKLTAKELRGSKKAAELLRDTYSKVTWKKELSDSGITK